MNEYNHDKLLELYNSGERELVYNIMDGLGLEYLDLGIDYDEIEFNLEIEGRSIYEICIYNNYENQNISLYMDEAISYINYEPTIKCLEKFNITHLNEFLITDSVGAKALSLDTPKEEIYKLIFKKI